VTASIREAPAPAPPHPPAKRGWKTPRLLALAGIGLPTLMILLVMSGAFASVTQLESFPFLRIDYEFPALLTANTPTGGDMGAHVFLPTALREDVLPTGRLLGWSNGWYAGFPVLYFYFPLPALATLLLDVLLPYGVAFKLVAVAGLVAFPSAVYFFVRRMGFSRPVSAIATATGSMYAFMESFSIFGANIKSTLAGEFAFSWSFTLSLFYLGLVIRDSEEGRRFSPAAGVVLALTALSHVVPTVVVVVASLPLLVRRRGAATLFSSWGLGFAIAAFWALPFGVRFLQGLTTDMGWSPVTGLVGEGIAPGTVATSLPNEFVPVFALGVVGFLWTAARRENVAVLSAMTVLPVFFYWLFQLPNVEFTAVYNARLLPYWYLGGFIFAGLALGLGVTRAARWLPLRHQNVAVGGVLAVIVVGNLTLAGVHDAPGWVRWNFTGYEGKETFAEYDALMRTIDGLPPGRVMWEVNSDQNRYGTPMALMLIPYWTDEHDSMEGVFFESSATTPFHFLNASEVSTRPSNPVRGLDYRPLDFERAIPHLRFFNISYYISFTEGAATAAREAGLEVTAEVPPWTIFAVPESSLVEVATAEPVVYAGEERFLDVALEYYDDVDELDKWIVADGPALWRRVDSDSERRSPVRLLDNEDAVITDVTLEANRMSFTTDAVGEPHMVKVSYFPNWTADGALGPYRAAPAFMVVVPTEENVVLEFRPRVTENIGMALTLGGLGIVVFVARRRRREASGSA
jgi:hypothetical protein